MIFLVVIALLQERFHMSRGWNLFPPHLQMSLVPAQHPNGLWWVLGAWGSSDCLSI